MKNKTTFITSVMGTIAGIAGMEHGLGEILQGNVNAGGLVFASWPESEMFANMAGEPAMSLMPNMFISGILSMIISLIFIYWAVKKTKHQYYGIGLLLLSFLLLLFGGGFGPPLLGIILGAVTLLSHPNHQNAAIGNNKLFSEHFGNYWKVLFSVTLALWLFLFPIFPLLSFIFHIQNGNIVTIVTPSAFFFLALSYISAGAWNRSNLYGHGV